MLTSLIQLSLSILVCNEPYQAYIASMLHAHEIGFVPFCGYGFAAFAWSDATNKALEALWSHNGPTYRQKEVNKTTT